MILFFNGVLFLTDWYLHVTLQTSFSTSSHNIFSTAGLIHDGGRSKTTHSCPSISKTTHSCPSIFTERTLREGCFVCTWKTKHIVLQETNANIRLLGRIGDYIYWDERVCVHIQNHLLHYWRNSPNGCVKGKELPVNGIELISKSLLQHIVCHGALIQTRNTVVA